METIFFHSHFLETIIAIRGRPIFKKESLISARGNRFQFIQILIQMEVAFRSSEIAFFKESFILASGNRCLLITNFVHLFGAFFC